MNAFEWQSDPAARSCGVHDHLQQAVKIMCETDCASVPVTDADGNIVGMITARDICVAAYRQCRPLWHMDVGSTMSRVPASGESGVLPTEPGEAAPSIGPRLVAVPG